MRQQTTETAYLREAAREAEVRDRRARALLESLETLVGEHFRDYGREDAALELIKAALRDEAAAAAQ